MAGGVLLRVRLGLGLALALGLGLGFGYSALLEVASDEGPRVLLPELGAVERLLGGALILPGARLELLPQPARMIGVIGVELPRLT